MKAADTVRGHLALRGLAVVDPRADAFELGNVSRLPELLRRGDLLVVNDAATVPGSLRVEGEPLEIRLLQRMPEGEWDAVLFGAGDWHTPTEHRPPPRRARPGERLTFAPGPRALEHLTARVESIDPTHPRRLRLRFEQTEAAFWHALHLAGRPVQYAHLREELSLWDVQTAYADRPWATEAPSAGHALSWALLLAFRKAGIALARITHACGLSSTGEPALDAALPLPERYEVPETTRAAIHGAHAEGGRVVAVGTSVVRALEAWGESGIPEGWTALKISEAHTPRVVDGLLSGMHLEGESHHALLSAFAPPALLSRALRAAERDGFLQHEYGDVMLVLKDALRPQVPAGFSSMAFSSPLASSSRMMSQPPTNFP